MYIATHSDELHDEQGYPQRRAEVVIVEEGGRQPDIAEAERPIQQA